MRRGVQLGPGGDGDERACGLAAVLTAPAGGGEERLELARRCSHDLRTPLASVRGYVELLLDGEFGAMSASQMEALEIVRRNVDRLSEAVEGAIDTIARD